MATRLQFRGTGEQPTGGKSTPHDITRGAATRHGAARVTLSSNLIDEIRDAQRPDLASTASTSDKQQ
jgi:hypothetical protein